MKKITGLLLGAMALLSLCACGKTEEIPASLEQYYECSEFKGKELYCWQDDGEWFCGLMGGTNRLKTGEEINALPAATLAQMREILDSYDGPDNEVYVIIVPHPCPETLPDWDPDNEDDVLELRKELGLE